MGVTVRPNCKKCGHIFEVFNQGGGFVKKDSKKLPTICYNCKKVVVNTPINGLVICDSCGFGSTPIKSFGQVFNLNKFQCPLCNQEELVFEIVQLWD